MLDREDLQSILDERKLTPLFQPILTCPGGEIWGHEALIRGPSSGALHSPLKLFQAAACAGRLVELDLLCRAAAVEEFSRIDCPGRLFLNVSPEAVVAREHPTGETMRMLQRAGIAPERIVIEITEQLPIHDYAIVRQAVAHYRANGFAVAIDDLGTGYAGLRHWSELRPDYVKIDRYFADGVQNDLSKREVVRSVIDMSRRMGTHVIVEGVETESEYMTLRSLGMTHAQGYLLGRPRPRPIDGSRPMPEDKGAALASPSRRACAGDLGRPVAAEPPSASLGALLARFHAEPDLRCVPLIDGDARPIGLVRRSVLLSRLAHAYGHALFAHRPVAGMESQAVTVPSDLPLEALSRRITDAAHGDEVFIVTDPEGRYHAIGSVYDLLRRITDLQIRNARHANPLTGLPGNMLIEQHIGSLLSAGASFVVVHADLDQFKPYNDHYGYQRGDEVILATARLLQAHLRDDEFAGHVGGDDFVLVMTASEWRPRCEALMNAFAARAPSFYDPGDRDRGWIETNDREGKRLHCPLLSISLAAVPVAPGRFTSHHVISTALAETKRCAKRQPGNSLFTDRRAHNAFHVANPAPEHRSEDSAETDASGTDAA